MNNSITQGFASQDNLLNTCASIGLLDKSGGIIQIPGFYYPDLGERFKANVVEQYKLNIVGINQGYMLEEQIFAPQELYKASGHVTNFHDPAVRCLDCGERFRADHLIEDAFDIQCAGMKPEALDEHLQNINCPKCGGKLNETRNRSLMATMQVSGREYFLAPETAQHIFLHFRDGLRRNGGKLPFSLHQINTATRGEITMDLKRRRQFYQMEEEFFYLHSSGQTDEFHKQKISQLKWSSLCAQKNKGLWQKFGVAPLAGCRAVVTGSCLDIPKNVKTATPRQPLQAQTDPTIMLRREP